MTGPLAFTRAEFPFLRRKIDGHPIIYLDSASTTPKPNFRGPTALAAGKLESISEGVIADMIVAYSQDDQDTYRIRKGVIGTGTSVLAGVRKGSRRAFATLRIGESLRSSGMATFANLFFRVPRVRRKFSLQ